MVCRSNHRRGRLAWIGLFVVVLGSCGGGQPDSSVRPAAPPEQVVFTEVAGEVGLDFVHFNGMSGERYIVEIMGQGAGLFDYDNDGDLDAYMLQGHMLGPVRSVEQAIFPPPDPLAPGDRLYRNDLAVGPDGSRSLRFTDVTEASGVRATGYGMGVATGDYDNDGWVDLYVTNWGANQMWRNNGDGSFRDVTETSGTADTGWGSSASFVDYDADGFLDLYVVNYLEFEFRLHVRCPTPASPTDYCGPQAYRGQTDRLFRNRGDGTFEDVSVASGIGLSPGKGLGVVAADLDGDGRVDLYVARDTEQNLLWLNRGDGTFHEGALIGGCALSAEGRPESGMGVDAGDFDGDGDDDLFVTHLARETNTIYVNASGGAFDDRSAASGLGQPSWVETGWGTAWFDYDNDSWLDLFVANGAISIIEKQARAGDPYPLRQINRLFHNRGGDGFDDVTDRSGPALALVEVSRGAVFGDVDNDGDTDILVVNNSGPARLLRNEVGSGRPWLGLRLIGADTPRDMLGARVEIVRADGSSLWRRVRADASYCSANDPRVLAGLGDGAAVERVRVIWPDGQVEQWTDLPAGRYTTLRQGSGD